MKTTTTLETDNLVLFPSAKNFQEESLSDADKSDPMYDLLNEYAHITDDQIPSYLDDRFEVEELEDELDESPVFGSLEAFMGRHQNQDNLTPDDKLVKLINEKMEAIKEARARIKFYLDEIDMFLPRRR